jgi:hypothetical protein
MFRPPPQYIWGLTKKKYEKQFRRKIPQWVLTLDRDFSRRLLSTCCKIGFKLHPEVLTFTELHDGPESIWSTKACYRLDGPAKPPKKINWSTQKP